MKRVIGMGNALVDVVVNLDGEHILNELGLPKGSMQLVDAGFSALVRERSAGFRQTLSSGGSAANTIHGLASLGIGTGFFGRVGIDEHGNFFGREMLEKGISPLLLQSGTPSGLAVALVTPDSERTFATFLGAAVELKPEDIQPETFEGFDLLHIEGYLVQNHHLIRKAVEEANRLGLLVSLDLASFNVVEANLDFLHDLLPLVDILFANEEEARSFTGHEPREALEWIATRCPVAVVKLGKEGAWIARGQERVKVPAKPVQPIDTTGAGDLFAAGFLFGWMNDRSLEICGKMGVVLASEVIQVRGAKIPDPIWDSIRKELESLEE